MKRTALTCWIAGVTGVAMVALAAAVAPKSCEGGLTVYFWAGVAAIVSLFIVPVALRSDLSGLKRAGLGVAFALFGMAVWAGGIAVTDMQLLCRLF